MGLTTRHTSHVLYEGLTAQEKARAAVINAFASNPEDFNKRFLVRQVIGFGTNGAVLAAQDISGTTGLPVVAIKIIYKRHAGRIEKTPPPEIDVLRHLSATGGSPYIVHSIADWQDLNHFYLVTELFGSSWIETVPEPTLRPLEFTMSYRNVNKSYSFPMFDGSSDLWAYAFVMRTHIRHIDGHMLLPLEPVKRIIKQVAMALLFIHEAGYFHGDVKCENILVAQTIDSIANIRLADFGHSRPINNGIKSYGTRAVSPPEFYIDAPFESDELDGRCSDIYGLGIVLYSLLNDKGLSTPPSPIPAGSTTIRYDELLVVDGGRYPLSGISELDQEGWNLLHSMCMVDPAQRITIKQVLSHPWLQEVVL
ncbi:UNVERIFIED_CONTAM: hypothetical protein HDU68_011009 [Siphonaria sp. JEL0065]|nr:hypothetical protein HDU68_011009 [Siphonaria sp. JEL0065]